jgi:hypothetical protein
MFFRSIWKLGFGIEKLAVEETINCRGCGEECKEP